MCNSKPLSVCSEQICTGSYPQQVNIMCERAKCNAIMNYMLQNNIKLDKIHLNIHLNKQTSQLWKRNFMWHKTQYV